MRLFDNEKKEEKIKIFKRFKLYQSAVIMALLAGICFNLCGCTGKKSESKVHRIGVLIGVRFFADVVDGLKAGMAELGYVEGENIIYDVQDTDVDITAYRRVLKKFVDDKVDLIFSFPTEASLEAKAVTQGTGIPVVFSIVNIENNNIINSIREPGGNITGVRYPGPDLAIIRLEIMRKLLPTSKRIVLCFQESYPVVPGQLKILRPAAASMGITLIEVPAESLEELQAGLDALNARGEPADAVLVIDGPIAADKKMCGVVLKFAADRNIPAGGVSQFTGKYETVYGISVDSFASGEKSAILVDKVLTGIPAGTIPVISSESVLEINYRMAQKFGLVVGEGLLIQANKIIR